MLPRLVRSCVDIRVRHRAEARSVHANSEHRERLGGSETGSRSATRLFRECPRIHREISARESVEPKLVGERI